MNQDIFLKKYFGYDVYQDIVNYYRTFTSLNSLSDSQLFDFVLTFLIFHFDNLITSSSLDERDYCINVFSKIDSIVLDSLIGFADY